MALIRNKLNPDGDRLFGSLAEAVAELDKTLKGFEAQDCVVSEIVDEEGRLYRVPDKHGRPVGDFYIE
jgi:hypothetical protein